MSGSVLRPPTVPATPAPVSRLSVGDGSARRGAVRTLPVHGLCVHTTGGGPARKAKGRPTTRPLQIALDYYVHGREGFPHYVVDYDGTIHAVCDEGHVAWHAGWFQRGGRRRWASWTAPTWWSAIWRPRDIRTPADLLPPQAGDPNAVFIGVELLADTTGWGFTNAQYDALARLVADLFRRHGVPLREPPNPRLLGHEDLEPVDRANADGGWDPGAHRRVPKFSWAALWSRVQTAGQMGPAAPAHSSLSPADPIDAVGAFAASVRRGLATSPMLASAVGAAETAAAFAGGDRDADHLADTLFHARHRERRRVPIAPGEAPLVLEWQRIRDHVIAPSLAAVAAVPPALAGQVGAQSAGPYLRTTPAPSRWAMLVPLLDRYRGEIPLEFLLGWIGVESDGLIDVVTRLDERGFFQIHPAESKDAHPPIDHHRLSTDPDYSVQAGIQLVRFYAGLGRRRFPWIPPNSELYWRVVKLQHAMGSGLAWILLSQMRARGIPTTWDAIKRFEVTVAPSLPGLTPTAHRLLTAEPGRFGRNVDRLFERGRAIVHGLGR